MQRKPYAKQCGRGNWTYSQKNRGPWISPPVERRKESLGAKRDLRHSSGRRTFIARIAQHVAAAPNGFDVVLATGCRLQLLAKFADENVDDLEFGFDGFTGTAGITVSGSDDRLVTAGGLRRLMAQAV